MCIRDSSKTDAELVYLEQFLDEEILSKLCYKTNLYAVQNKSKNWKDITVSKLKAFLGIDVIMEIHVLHHLVITGVQM